MRLRHFVCAAAAVLFAFAHTAADAACPNPRLEDFGYNHRPLAGPRPLLTILVDFDDAEPNPARGEAYFRRTLFGATNSVNAMYYAASGGRFNWTQAGVVNVQWRGPSTGLPDDFSQRILRMAADAMRARTGPGARTMESFDRNGDHVITNNELVILRVTNSPAYRGGAQTTWYAADLGAGYRFDGGTSNVDEEVDINTYAHELWHALGSQDHSYGPGAALNTQATFFAASWGVANSPGMVGLDPYERMRAGWIRPQLVEMSTSGSRGVRLYGDSPPDHTLLFYSNERCAGEFFLGEFRNASRSSVDSGMFGAGVLLWYVKPTADFSPYQFNWPPPIRGPYAGPAPNHMIANYIVSRNGPGVRGVIAAATDEFNPSWGDGAATNFSISTNYRPDDEQAFIGWRRSGGRFVARIDAINNAARPAPIALGSTDRIAITGQFPVDSRGLHVELVNFSGRTTIAMVSYRADRIELRQPTSLAAGAYQIHLVGDASREILTRGNQLVTFR